VAGAGGAGAKAQAGFPAYVRYRTDFVPNAPDNDFGQPPIHMSCDAGFLLHGKEIVLRNYSLMLLGAVLLSGGCGKKDDTQPATGQPPAMKAGEAPPPATATPNPPANPPKGNTVPMPEPGQAGDHSSPAFKDGGKTDKTKN
jgi:hypothetical protein